MIGGIDGFDFLYENVASLVGRGVLQRVEQIFPIVFYEGLQTVRRYYIPIPDLRCVCFKFFLYVGSAYERGKYLSLVFMSCSFFPTDFMVLQLSVYNCTDVVGGIEFLQLLSPAAVEQGVSHVLPAHSLIGDRERYQSGAGFHSYYAVSFCPMELLICLNKKPLQVNNIVLFIKIFVCCYQ